MSIAENLVKARSHIVFLLGLVTACAIIIAVELTGPSGSSLALTGQRSVASARPPLETGQRAAALAAWRTFVANPGDAAYPKALVLAKRLGVADAEAPPPGAAPPLDPPAALAVLSAIDAVASASPGSVAQ